MSEPIAQQLRARYEQPVTVVLNGFDQSDIPDAAPPRDPTAPLRILYTGMIYPGRRDPEPLFRALRLMGDEAAGVRVVFYGRYLQSARELAQRHGVEHLVEINDCVLLSRVAATSAGVGLVAVAAVERSATARHLHRQAVRVSRRSAPHFGPRA